MSAAAEGHTHIPEVIQYSQNWEWLTILGDSEVGSNLAVLEVHMILDSRMAAHHTTLQCASGERNRQLDLLPSLDQSEWVSELTPLQHGHGP